MSRDRFVSSSLWLDLGITVSKVSNYWDIKLSKYQDVNWSIDVKVAQGIKVPWGTKVLVYQSIKLSR